jgi:hypothetical protein
MTIAAPIYRGKETTRKAKGRERHMESAYPKPL